MLQLIADRIYSDFFMPSRIGQYRELLRSCLQNGFTFASIENFMALSSATKSQSRRYLLLRHDIDTDLETSRAMWRVEQELGIESSYYFRLCTADQDFMREIAKSGSAVGYHYEELATLAKRWRIKQAQVIIGRLDEIRQEFRRNLNDLRLRTGLPLTSAASHGDFANRQLGLDNRVILASQEFRRAMGIVVEAYDDDLMNHVNARFADAQYPKFWQPVDITSVIQQRSVQVLYVLVHPRQWSANRKVNLRENALRLWEGVRFLPCVPLLF